MGGNYRVYGARKLWKAARRAGLDVGRDQVARLMRAAGIEGRATEETGAHHAGRDTSRCPAPGPGRTPIHRPTRPNRLWVTDLTYVATWSGVAYVCFIIDAYSRKIVGWRVAVETCARPWCSTPSRWPAGHAAHKCWRDCVVHSDAGNRSSRQCDTANSSPRSVQNPPSARVGDSYDNTLAETVNGYYKAELIRGPARPGPWRTVEDVELATLGWVHWHNTSGCTATSTTYRPPNSKGGSTLRKSDQAPVGIK